MLELIVKEFDCSLTAEESYELNNWRTKPGNDEAYIALKELWQNAEKASHFAAANPKRELHKLYEKVMQPRRNRKWYWSAAASLLLLMSVAGYLNLSNNDSTAKIEYAVSTEIQELTLNDGTLVSLNKGAKLTQLKGFGDKERRVRLEGEAFFEVAKNPEKPFIIESGVTQTKVLGTAFNVETHDLGTTVSVEHGKVSFGTSDASLVLFKDEAGVYSASTGKSVKQQVDLNYLAWKTGKLIFQEDPLSKAVTDLSDFYEVRIEIRDLEEYNVTSIFDNQPLEEVLEELKLLLGLEIDNNGSRILLYPSN